MQAEPLRQMIANGETLTVEFKSDCGPLSDEDLVATVVCMANYQGGTLLIGVEDDGQVTGLHARHQSSPGALAGFIASRTVPPLSVEVQFVDTPLGSVAMVGIPAARQPVATSDGRLTIRHADTHGKPACRPLYPHELVNWQAEHGTLDPSALPISGATWDDLDPLEFTRLRRMVEENHGDAALLELADVEIARALGLVHQAKEGLTPTVAGLLLVGKEGALREHVPAHEVAFQVLQDSAVRLNEFRRWPLLRTLEWVLEAFGVRNEERELNLGMFRVAVPAYDRRGFREAVNNAFIHRDYTRLGAVHIQMHADHIRIGNPGGFVLGVRPDNLLVTDPHPRNPRLADAFKRIGLVERVGRGVSIIYAGQLRNGRLAPSYSASTAASVTVSLPGGAADLQFVEFIVSEENRRQRAFQLNEMLVLAHVWRERQIDVHLAAQLMQREETEARATLESLVESGLIEARGSGKGRAYLLSASVYRALGQPAAYVRARGFESAQMEQMILQYTKAHGQIYRNQVMELCRVSARQATYLLQKLVRRRSLLVRGEGRGRSYVLAEMNGTNK